MRAGSVRRLSSWETRRLQTETPFSTTYVLTPKFSLKVIPTMSDVEFVFMSRKHNESFGRDLCEEWLKQIAEQLSPEEQKRIAVVQSSLQKLEPPYSHFDCIVSPANSYGIMDGGLVTFLISRCTQFDLYFIVFPVFACRS